MNSVSMAMNSACRWRWQNSARAAVSAIRVIGFAIHGYWPAANPRVDKAGAKMPFAPGFFGMISMHVYRSHTCGQLRLSDAGQTVRLSGWVHRKRDHGNLLFVDLRDHYGITQCVLDTSSPLFRDIEAVRPESVVTVTCRVVKRTAETV